MNYANLLTDRIYTLLKPLVGEIMGRGIIKVQAKKLGIAEEGLTLEHLPQIAKSIEKGLVIFVGSDKSQEIRRDIEKLTVN